MRTWLLAGNTSLTTPLTWNVFVPGGNAVAALVAFASPGDDGVRPQPQARTATTNVTTAQFINRIIGSLKNESPEIANARSITCRCFLPLIACPDANFVRHPTLRCAA